MIVNGYEIQAGANLKDANLQGANLQGANLQGAYLRGADLRGADLKDAYLQGANLKGAYLRGADLRGTYLGYADLRGAYLRGADLEGTNLGDADLQDAYLRGADLKGAYLRGADLRGADLEGADLRGADLKDADLEGATLPPYAVCPQEGSFVAYKKLSGGVVAKILIPDDALRTSNLVGRKCRASHVHVIEFLNTTRKSVKGWRNAGGTHTVYNLGATVYADSFDDDIRIECTHGIHFFITREEAEAW